MTEAAPKLIETDHGTREVWLKARRSCVGGSEIPALLGCDVYGKTPLQVWESKVMDTDDGPQPYFFKRGHQMEPLLAEWYTEATGRTTRNAGDYVIAQRSDFPLIGVTLDYEDVDTEAGPGAVELKYLSSHVRRWFEDGAPVGYQMQNQTQMWVKQFQRGALVADLGEDEPRYYDFTLHPQFEDTVKRVVETFWEKHVIPQVPPPPMAGDDEVIRRLYPNATKGLTIELPPLVQAWVEHWEALKEERKVIDDQLSKYENALKLAMEDAETGLLPEGGCLTYKNQKRKEVIQPACEFRVLRRVKA